MTPNLLHARLRFSQTTLTLALACLAILFTACSDDKNDPTEVEYIDESTRTCIAAESPRITQLDALPTFELREGEPFVVVIDHYAAGDRDPVDVDIACTVTHEGQQLTVQSRSSWREYESRFLGLRQVFGTCAVDGLAAGDYTLQHGDTSLEITVPAEYTHHCAF